MQRELQAQGNKFEIIDFVKSRMKMTIGVEKASTPMSILKNREQVEDGKEKEEEDGKDPNVEGLPKKVDEFMAYINRVYFDGKLDNEGKELFKSDLEREYGGDFEHYGFENPVQSTKPRRKILITT